MEAAQHTQCTVRVMMDATRWSESVAAFNLFKSHRTIRTEPVRLLPDLANRVVASCQYTPEQDGWIHTTPSQNIIDWGFEKRNPKFRSASIGSNFYWSDGSVDEFGESNQLLNNNLTDFRGWSCNIGLESLFIFWDGTVKKGNCHQGGVLFSIDDHHNHPLPTTAELCFQPICHCGTDILITKAPILPADSPIVAQHLQDSMVRSQEDYERQHRQYIKIKPL